MGCLIVDESELQKAAEVLLDADNSADIVPFVENIKRLWLSGYGCDIHFAVGIECKVSNSRNYDRMLSSVSFSGYCLWIYLSLISSIHFST